MTDAFFEEKLKELKDISDEDVSSLTEAVKANSDDLLNWDLLCGEFYNLERFSDALEIIDYAIKIDSNVSNFWTAKGMILFDLGKIEESIKCFEASLRLDPTDDEVWEHLILSLAGDYYNALEAIDRAIKFHPNDSKFWFYKGENLFDISMFQEAIEAINKGLELDPEDFDAWYRLVHSYYIQSDYENALDTINHVLELEPDDSVMLELKSMIINDMEKAEQSLDKLFGGKTYKDSSLDDFR